MGNRLERAANQHIDKQTRIITTVSREDPLGPVQSPVYFLPRTQKLLSLDQRIQLISMNSHAIPVNTMRRQIRQGQPKDPEQATKNEAGFTDHVSS
jgi:hypothetical protein